MRKIHFLISAAILTTSTACHHEANEMGHHHDHGHEHNEAKKDAGGEIVIEPAQAKLLGIETSAIERGDFPETIKVSGEFITPPESQATVTAKSAGIVTLTPNAKLGADVKSGSILATISARGVQGGDAFEVAALNLATAKKELERITPLYEEGIVSARDYNAAKQAYETALAAAGNSSAAGSNAQAPISGVVTDILINQGAYVEAGQAIATISAPDAIMLRAMIPQRFASFISKLSAASVIDPITGETIGLSPVKSAKATASHTTAVNGYIPVYFDAKKQSGFTNGTYCEVTLFGENESDVVSVPKSALSEQQGKYFVYIKLDDDCYEKRAVEIGRKGADRVEIINGLTVGENVVTVGAPYVHIAENASAVPEGHSHSH